MIEKNTIKQFIYNKLNTSPDELYNRGFPLQKNGEVFYKDVDLGDFGKIDLLSISRNKKTGLLIVDLYHISESSMGINDIKHISNCLEGVCRWINNSSGEHTFHIQGNMLAQIYREIQPCFLKGNVLNFYTYDTDLIEGLYFQQTCSLLPRSSVTGKTLDIQIPLKRVKKKA